MSAAAVTELEPAAGFVFPAGYVTREYTRDVLSRVEQRYFDGMEESKDPAKARVVLDKIDLCHQAGIHNYDDVTAFLEGRASFEEIVKTQAEIAEARQKQLEQQRMLREKEKSQRAVALELPGQQSYLQARTHARARAHTHIHTHARARARAHTHTHTHTHITRHQSLSGLHLSFLNFSAADRDGACEQLILKTPALFLHLPRP